MKTHTGQNGNGLACQRLAVLPNGNVNSVRRRLLAGSVGGVVSSCFPGTVSAASLSRKPLRIGTTAVFLNEQLQLLDVWRQDLRDILGFDVQFVQRRSYGEIVELLLNRQLDAAWICGFPYVQHADSFRLLAVPVYQGQPLYRSYLIVQEENRQARGIADLYGCVFAYSDPLSNSGFLVPMAQMASVSLDPSRFFRKAMFTFAHRKVVQAVASGLADAGAVDGYVWDTIAEQFPEWTNGARVAWRSEYYGFPPIVARHDLEVDQFHGLQHALLSMTQRPRGRLILSRLCLDRFSVKDPGIYDDIRSLLQSVNPAHLSRANATAPAV